jgi:YaaC-like Protein
MYLPLANCAYIVESTSKRAFFRADFAKGVPLRNAISRLPAIFVADPAQGEGAIRSAAELAWRRPRKPTATEIEGLASLNRTLRQDLHYINGLQALWYVKAKTPGPRRLQRQLPTLILGAMHRLSEICRYQPLQLASLPWGTPRVRAALALQPAEGTNGRSPIFQPTASKDQSTLGPRH